MSSSVPSPPHTPLSIEPDLKYKAHSSFNKLSINMTNSNSADFDDMTTGFAKSVGIGQTSPVTNPHLKNRHNTVQRTLPPGPWRHNETVSSSNGGNCFSSSASLIAPPNLVFESTNPFHRQQPPAQVKGVPSFDPQNAYSYAYDRGNGYFTRLVPVDELPPTKGIEKLQRSAEGLIIVPEPHSRSLEELKTKHDSIQVKLSNSIPRPGIADKKLQGRIDNIIASTSRPLSAASLTNSVSSPTSQLSSLENPSPLTSVYSHPTRPRQTVTTQPAKREKVYCDMWLHQGRCGFAQTGCKYKHEMPMDRATQQQVGLYRGLPEWYVRAQAVELRPSGALPKAINWGARGDAPSPLARGGGAATTPAGRVDSSRDGKRDSVQSGGVSLASLNPYDMLGYLDNEDA